jgi:hypothetical protein
MDPHVTPSHADPTAVQINMTDLHDRLHRHIGRLVGQVEMQALQIEALQSALRVAAEQLASRDVAAANGS